MEYSIVFISPYKKLGELFQKVCSELGKDIPVQIGDLEEGALVSRELEEKGVDVIISRGGTAVAIKKAVTDVPVVEIQVGPFDLLRVLQKIKNETQKIVIAGFHTFTYGLEGLEEILGIKLQIITLKEEWYNRINYIEDKLREVMDQGIHWIVGDNISVKIARKIGMNVHLIKSGKEALVQAILEAERVAKVRKLEMEKAKRVKSIVDNAYEGIVSIDQRGKVDIFNPRAEEIFEIKNYKMIGQSICTVLPDLDLMDAFNTGHQENDKLLMVNGKEIVCNIIPVKINNTVVRIVVTFQKASRIRKVEQKIREKLLMKGHIAETTYDDIIGRSFAIRKIKEETRDYSMTDSPILICGETGTGKEMFAQSIHNSSSRKSKPFIAFNCAALPENLIESELFGYVEGAFTGASKSGKAGIFEQAYGGTIFLDEIGETTIGTQVRLLRVIQENKIRRIGDDKLTTINVRIIGATNRDLRSLIRKGRLREDLYYRINVLNLTIPPLRERKEDIPLLVEFFIKKYSSKINQIIKGVSKDGLKIIMRYHWPGNIRQLENIVERLMIRSREGYITTELVRGVMDTIMESTEARISHGEDSIEISGVTVDLSRMKLQDVERVLIKRVLVEEKGNRIAAAKRLGIGRTTLWRKLNP